MHGMTKAPVREDVARRLKEARARIFATAAEAAEALDMKAVTLRAHENGQNGVNVYDLERYARRYGVSVQWLMTGEGPETPDPTRYDEAGELIPIENIIEAGRWIPEDDPSRRTIRPAREWVVYTDPRFPTPMVSAIRIEKADPDAHYISGTILFIVEVADVGYRDGDHVILYRERGDFVNLSVRRVVSRPGEQTRFQSLTDTLELDVVSEETDKEALPQVTAVVIGSLTRRPMPPVSVGVIREFEKYERSRRFTPADWRQMKKEAEAIVSGKMPPGGPDEDAFQSVEEAQQFLDLQWAKPWS